MSATDPLLLRRAGTTTRFSETPSTRGAPRPHPLARSSACCCVATALVGLLAPLSERTPPAGKRTQSHSERKAIRGFTSVARRAGNTHTARPATMYLDSGLGESKFHNSEMKPRWHYRNQCPRCADKNQYGSGCQELQTHPASPSRLLAPVQSLHDWHSARSGTQTRSYRRTYSSAL